MLLSIIKRTRTFLTLFLEVCIKWMRNERTSPPENLHVKLFSDSKCIQHCVSCPCHVAKENCTPNGPCLTANSTATRYNISSTWGNINLMENKKVGKWNALDFYFIHENSFLLLLLLLLLPFPFYFIIVLLSIKRPSGLALVVQQFFFFLFRCVVGPFCFWK